MSFPTCNHEGRLNQLMQTEVPNTVAFIDLAGEETRIPDPAPVDANANTSQEMACRPSILVDITDTLEECAICDNKLRAVIKKMSVRLCFKLGTV